MKLEILKDELKKAMSICEKVTRKNISLPILQNVLLKAEGNFLEINSTNLETTICWWILSHVEVVGKVVVPAGLFSSLISLITDEKIELRGDGGNLLIVTQNQKNQIQGQDPSEFPIIPKVDTKNTWGVPSEQLIAGLSQVVDIPSTSQVRPNISGIFFSFKKNKLIIAGTDSFRLAEKTIILDNNFKKEGSFILPQVAAKELLNILSQCGGNVAIYTDANQVMFEFSQEGTSYPQVNLLSRLVEGEFPDYQEILPKQYTTQVRVDRESLVNQVKKASLFSGRVAEVRLVVSGEDQQLSVLSQSTEVGKNESLMRCAVEGQNVTVALNHRFLIDGLISVKSSEVTMDFHGEDGVVIIRPVGDASYFYILMPIKMA